MGSQLHQSAMATPCLKSSVPSMSDGVIEECELKIESVEIVLTKSPFLAAAKKGGRHTLGIAIDYKVCFTAQLTFPPLHTPENAPGSLDQCALWFSTHPSAQHIFDYLRTKQEGLEP